MANPFEVNVLGGYDLGRGLSQLGQTFANRQAYDEQQSQEAQMQELQQRAFSGDAKAIQQLAAINPELASKMQKRVTGQEQIQFNDMQKRTAEYIARANALPIEQREAYFDKAINNPNLDIDEEDRVYFTNPDQAKAVVGQVLGEDYAKSIYGDQGEVKTETIQTPTGIKVINKDTGETVKDVVVPEKETEFKALQAERKRKLEESKAKELARIETAKIKKADAAEARQSALETTKRAFSLTRELGNENVIAPVTGWYDRKTPTGDKSQDVINKALELKDLLTLNNLGLMSGVLTDRDIAILARAGSGLNVDEDGFLGSETGVVNQIKKVEKMMDQKLKAAVKRGDLSQLDYEQMISQEIQADDSTGTTAGGVTYKRVN